MTYLFHPTWIIGAVLALVLVPASADDRPPAGAKPLSEIIQSMEEQGFTITEVEYDDDEWELEGYSQEDDDVEIEVNPVTGEIEVED